MPLTLEIRLSLFTADGALGTAASTGTLPRLSVVSGAEPAVIPESDGSDMGGGRVPSAEVVTPVIDGEPAGDPEGDDLRALRDDPEGGATAGGRMLGDPLLGDPVRWASEGLAQRIGAQRSTKGVPLACGALEFASLRIAATLSKGLLMGAFLSQCICQFTRFFGLIDKRAPRPPLVTADSAGMQAVVERPQKTARSDRVPEAIAVASSAVLFPAYVAAASPFPKSAESTDNLVVTCQRAVLEGYCTLVSRGVFPCGIDIGQVAMESGNPLCHPVQDPTGALAAALLIVRRNQSNLRASNPSSLTSRGRLGMATRRILGAIFTVTHKMTAHAACVTYRTFADHCVRVMQSPLDVPKYEYDWTREMSAMMLAEKAVLGEPLLSLTTENVLGELERVIDYLQKSIQLADADASIMRGMAFFFYGSLLFQEDVAGVDAFVGRVGTRSLAAACALVSLACFAAASLRETGSCKPASSYAGAIAKSGGGRVRRAAAVLLEAALSPEAEALRMGPYEEYPLDMGTPHPVQMLLHPSNIARARAKAGESGWISESEN